MVIYNSSKRARRAERKLTDYIDKVEKYAGGKTDEQKTNIIESIQTGLCSVADSYSPTIWSTCVDEGIQVITRKPTWSIRDELPVY